MMISIICPSNNGEVLKNCLVKSLNKQSYKDYELIIVDTKKDKFNSAVEALEYGANIAKGEYLMFVHHDVLFEKKDELQNIVNSIKKINDDFGIIGVAGIDANKAQFVGNITNGENHEKITDYIITEPQKVCSVDELLFIIKKECLNKNPFDINNKTWHLYAVEYCLKMHNINKGVYVIPSDLYHVSDGKSMNNSYFKELRRLRKEYKDRYSIIYTTCGGWYTKKLLSELQIIKYKYTRIFNK